MKYEVYRVKQGCVEVEADSTAEARRIAFETPDSKVRWEEDPEDMYIEWIDESGRIGYEG